MIDKKKTTIYEVAKEAGVSRQTVSRVLNNRPDVSRETRKRIKDIMEMMEYHPSAIARSLRSPKSFTLGVVTAGLKFLGPSRTLSGITQGAEELGYSLLLKELASYSANNVYPLLQLFLAHHVDGIIWAAPEIGDNRAWLLDLPVEIDIPIIFLTMEKRTEVSIVSIDNYWGGRLATEHLISLGRTRIGHIAGPLDWWEACQRKCAWEDALADANLLINERMWVEGNWSSKSGKSAFDELLNRFPEMDAVFVGNDQMALSVLQTAAERGIRIPSDLAVIGFDGIPESEFYSPSLSTVYQNQDELGRTAVQELVRLVDEKLQDEEAIQPSQISLNPELIVRDSTQPYESA
jgi:DNA-binding LacI/PurR family transcriptional regulator